MKKIALFPGSFDPFTIGHESIVMRSLPLFDKLIIGVGINLDKKYFFPLDKRVEWIQQLFANEPKIEVHTYEGLTVDFCDHVGAKYLLRGLRTSADFEFERAVGQTNSILHPDIESVFLLTRPEHTFVSSSIVRDVYMNGGDISYFIPKKMNLEL
jgi:pantetheine-phosphate adenylyltransferase